MVRRYIIGCARPRADTLVVNMDATFFANNRQKLREKLRHGSLVVMTGYGEVQWKHDTAVPFAQEANFYYLSGVEAPDWWYMADGISGKEYLVRPDVSDMKAIFDGNLSAGRATEVSGIKDVVSRDEAMRILRTWVKTHSIVYTTAQPDYLTEAGFQLNQAQHELRKRLERSFESVQTINRQLAELRSIKQPQEIVAIEKAIHITEKAFLSAKALLPAAKYEYEVEAEMTKVIRSSGARGHAYEPIIATGKNACTLHYVSNNAKLSKKQLLLIDVGASVNGYAADVTRTYALGKPSKRQIAVHEAVRQAQQACIELLQPGLNAEHYSNNVDEIMKAALRHLGLSTEKYRTYFPHSIGHSLGLDVHDVSSGQAEFQPGMVVTVEPGIYIPEENIGVRIEDDILITPNGHRNLSAKLSTEY